MVDLKPVQSMVRRFRPEIGTPSLTESVELSRTGSVAGELATMSLQAPIATRLGGVQREQRR